jgi:alcohol dehydrogenase (cytochrome c)
VHGERHATPFSLSCESHRHVARATGGALVFGGDVAGNFHAFDETSGEVLWETNLGAPVNGYPVSFAAGGKQHVAVTTGPSLVAAASRRVKPELSGDSSAARVVVFALP